MPNLSALTMNRTEYPRTVSKDVLVTGVERFGLNNNTKSASQLKHHCYICEGVLQSTDLCYIGHCKTTLPDCDYPGT